MSKLNNIQIGFGQTSWGLVNQAVRAAILSPVIVIEANLRIAFV